MSFVKILGYLVKKDRHIDACYFMDNYVTYKPIETSYPVYVCATFDTVLEATGTMDELEDLPVTAGLFHSRLKELNESLGTSDCCSQICSLLSNDGDNPVCVLKETYGPFYVFPYTPKKTIDCAYEVSQEKIYWCIAHPDEKERMERILNGTNNPLYDLVHELRYNPAIPARLSVERREAKEDFEQKKRQRIEGEN